MIKRILRSFVGIGIGALVLVSLWMLMAKLAPTCTPCNSTANRPLVIAHQGGDGERPSNTMVAFEHAIALGVDMLEMDIHASSDGVIVLSHDDKLDRLTDGTGLIKEKTLTEIKQIDAAYDWSPDDKGTEFPYRGQGITVPTLEEILQSFPDQPMNIEIKQESPSIGMPFCDLIRQYRMTDNVLVASFSQRTMDDFRRQCPEVTTSLTADETASYFYRHLLLVSETYSPPAAVVQVPEERSGFHILTSRFVTGAHARTLQVHAWTINEEADMQRMIDLGVDGIITDNPSRLLALLGR